MLFFKRKKKVKEKQKRNWYSFSAKLTMAIIFLVIIAFTFTDMFNFFKSNSSDISSTLSIINKEVDLTKLLTSNAPVNNKEEISSSLITKINDANLEILTDGQIDKNKFKVTDISISQDFTLSDQEFTLLFSDLVKTLSEGVLIDSFLEVTITDNNGSYILYTVMKLNLDELLNSVNGLKGLEIYLTNSYEFTFKNNTFTITSSTTKVNNLSFEESANIINTLNEGNENNTLNINEISFHFFELFINNFTYKTSSFVTFSNHQISFQL